MCLMKLIKDVYESRKVAIISFFASNFLIILFYWLLFDKSEILYPLALSLFVFVIYFAIELIKYRDFLEKLDDAKQSPNYVAKDVNPKEDKILDSLKNVHDIYNKKLMDITMNIRERDALFSQWIHNMKTSLTVIDLAYDKGILKGDEKECLEDINVENQNLKKNLEEALNVIRLDEFYKDYIPEKYNLKELVSLVINSKKRDFIYSGVFPQVHIDEDIIVYTDKKWCIYMISQIVDNSIKYSSKKQGKKVYIYARRDNKNVILYIKDEGIGIKREDISRVFDAFFTGNNGRNERNATGIGLYMVKNICRKLGHRVVIESKYEIGTEVRLTFLSKL